MRILGTKKLQCDQFLVYLLRSKRSKCWWANFNSFKEGDNPFPFLEHLAFYWHEIRQKTKNTHANFLKIAYFICSIELGSTRFMGTSWVCQCTQLFWTDFGMAVKLLEIKFFSFSNKWNQSYIAYQGSKFKINQYREMRFQILVFGAKCA